MIQTAFTVLKERALAGQITADVMQKVTNLAHCIANRNFAGSNLIQTVLLYLIMIVIILIYFQLLSSLGFGKYCLEPA